MNLMPLHKVHCSLTERKHTQNLTMFSTMHLILIYLFGFFFENINFHEKHLNRIANKLRNPFTVNDLMIVGYLELI